MEREEYLFLGLLAILDAVVGGVRPGVDPLTFFQSLMAYLAMRHGLPTVAKMASAAVSTLQPPPPPPQ